MVFRSGNHKEELKTVQRELRRRIREGEKVYRTKMEDQLQQNNISGVWKGLKTMSGYKGPNQQPMGDQKWVNDLNLFFYRFNQLSTPPSPIQSSLLLQPPVDCPSSPPSPQHLAPPLPHSSYTTLHEQRPTPLPTTHGTQPPSPNLSLTTDQVRIMFFDFSSAFNTGVGNPGPREPLSCMF